MVSVESFFAVIFRKKVFMAGGKEDPEDIWSEVGDLAGDVVIMNFALKVEFKRPF